MAEQPKSNSGELSRAEIMRRMTEAFERVLEARVLVDEPGPLAKLECNPGRYYSRRPMDPRLEKERYKFFTEMRERAHELKDWETKWFAQLMLDGAPESVSDFVMECLFVLRKSDGTVDRLVRLRNILGEAVYGIDHAAWMAMCQMPSASAEETVKSKKFMVTHVQTSSADVTSSTNSMAFLTDMLTATKAEAVPLSCFRLEILRLAHAPGRPNQTGGLGPVPAVYRSGVDD